MIPPNLKTLPDEKDTEEIILFGVFVLLLVNAVRVFRL